MMSDNQKLNKCVTIPYFVHEGELFRMEVINRRLTAVCICSLIALAILARK